MRRDLEGGKRFCFVRKIRRPAVVFAQIATFSQTGSETKRFASAERVIIATTGNMAASELLSRLPINRKTTEVTRAETRRNWNLVIEIPND